MDLLYLFDLAGVAVFAISGAMVASRKELNLFGGVVLAIVTGIGGGTLRDIFLGEDVFWIKDPTYIILAGGVALATGILGDGILLRGKLLLVADAFGLALFTVIGTAKALTIGTPLTTAMIMGMLTGSAGGMIRDVLAGEMPMVFREELYATTSVAGATIFILAVAMHFDGRIAALACLLTTLSLRSMAIHWKIGLPPFRHSSKKEKG